MLNNIFRINMPYGIKGNNNKGWYFFNREYLPLGCIETNKTDPIFIKYDINDSDFDTLFNLNCGRQKRFENEEEYIFIFFYNDSTNPVNSNVNKNTNWANYIKIMKFISTFKRLS
jgi:hypothetical protein